MKHPQRMKHESHSSTIASFMLSRLETTASRFVDCEMNNLGAALWGRFFSRFFARVVCRRWQAVKFKITKHILANVSFHVEWDESQTSGNILSFVELRRVSHPQIGLGGGLARDYSAHISFSLRNDENLLAQYRLCCCCRSSGCDERENDSEWKMCSLGWGTDTPTHEPIFGGGCCCRCFPNRGQRTLVRTINPKRWLPILRLSGARPFLRYTKLSSATSIMGCSGGL